MTCRELIDFLMSYLDGELPAAQNRSFEDHLDLCPACTAKSATSPATACRRRSPKTSSKRSSQHAELAVERWVELRAGPT
jgi:anti-sigma factor RsiW